MKALNKYINESVVNEGNWSFTDYERGAFATSLGCMTGALGDDEEQSHYLDFRNMLSKEELKQLDDVYNVIDDSVNYRKINSRMLKQDMPLLKRFAQWMEDNDIADVNGQTDWDLIDAYEKILY